MAVTTDTLRSLTATRYVDNTAQEIDAADLRAGMTLIADVIDDTVNAIALAASFGFPLYDTVELALADVKIDKGFSIVEEDGVAIYKNSAGTAEKLQTLLVASSISTLAADVTELQSATSYASILRPTWAELAELAPSGIAPKWPTATRELTLIRKRVQPSTTLVNIPPSARRSATGPGCNPLALVENLRPHPT